MKIFAFDGLDEGQFLSLSHSRSLTELPCFFSRAGGRQRGSCLEDKIESYTGGNQTPAPPLSPFVSFPRLSLRCPEQLVDTFRHGEQFEIPEASADERHAHWKLAWLPVRRYVHDGHYSAYFRQFTAVFRRIEPRSGRTL